MAPVTLPEGLTGDEVIEAVEMDRSFGFCMQCGLQHDNVEPDAREYECEGCESASVYGAEEILIMLG